MNTESERYGENKIKKNIAIIGGKGKFGQALAYRLLAANYQIYIGSRTPHLKPDSLVDNPRIVYTDHESAIRSAQLIVLAIPYESALIFAENLMSSLFGKTLIIPIVNMISTQSDFVESSAQRLKRILGKNVNVCSAFQTISSHTLRSTHYKSKASVLVCSDALSTYQKVDALIKDIQLRSIYCGGLENSLAVEKMTHVLIDVNKYYNSNHSSIQIVFDRETLV